MYVILYVDSYFVYCHFGKKARVSEICLLFIFPVNTAALLVTLRDTIEKGAERVCRLTAAFGLSSCAAGICYIPFPC